MVDPAGLEPATTRLWAECSDQTELWIHVYGVSGGIRTPDPRLRRALLYPAELQIHKLMVRHTRFELVTTRLKVVCSTNWANDANGVTDEARTRDNQCHKLALYQLNYGHHYNISFWSGKRGSNSRHSAWKADALPTELFPHFNGRNSKIWTCGPLLPRQVRYRAALYSDLYFDTSLF